MWTILKTVSKGEYTYAIVPEHPFATKNGYVLEHRIVMENIIGRLLTDTEIVHHRNGDKKDNDPTNLEVQSRKNHARYHNLLRGRKTVLLICPECDKQFVRYHSKTFLANNCKSTCCSRSCQGKFSRKIQLYGITLDIKRAMNKNVVKIYKPKAQLDEQRTSNS